MPPSIRSLPIEAFASFFCFMVFHPHVEYFLNLATEFYLVLLWCLESL